jgi:iron complex outermembrane receptor protein
LSGLFDGDFVRTVDPTLDSSISTVQFFVNGVNTTNYGLDIILDYTKSWGKNRFTALLAGNIQDVQLDDIHVPALLNTNELDRKTFYSDREIAFLKASAPKQKANLSLGYTHNQLGFTVNLNYFGKIKLLGFGIPTTGIPGVVDDNPNASGINPRVPSDANPDVYLPEAFNFNSKVTTDVSVSYKLLKRMTVFIGADNVFNVHPNVGVNQQAKGYCFDNESGGPWDSVQMGFNGRRLFGKISLNF